ncbi:MAG: hypothetical protein ACOX2O_09185 [Bdellovibrionota bacterium]|jgi:hypothetical protein
MFGVRRNSESNPAQGLSNRAQGSNCESNSAQNGLNTPFKTGVPFEINDPLSEIKKSRKNIEKLDLDNELSISQNSLSTLGSYDTPVIKEFLKEIRESFQNSAKQQGYDLEDVSNKDFYKECFRAGIKEVAFHGVINGEEFEIPIFIRQNGARVVPAIKKEDLKTLKEYLSTKHPHGREAQFLNKKGEFAISGKGLQKKRVVIGESIKYITTLCKKLDKIVKADPEKDHWTFVETINGREFKIPFFMRKAHARTVFAANLEHISTLKEYLSAKYKNYIIPLDKKTERIIYGSTASTKNNPLAKLFGEDDKEITLKSESGKEVTCFLRRSGSIAVYAIKKGDKAKFEDLLTERKILLPKAKDEVPLKYENFFSEKDPVLEKTFDEFVASLKDNSLKDKALSRVGCRFLLNGKVLFNVYERCTEKSKEKFFVIEKSDAKVLKKYLQNPAELRGTREVKKVTNSEKEPAELKETRKVKKVINSKGSKEEPSVIKKDIKDPADKRRGKRIPKRSRGAAGKGEREFDATEEDDGSIKIPKDFLTFQEELFEEGEDLFSDCAVGVLNSDFAAESLVCDLKCEEGIFNCEGVTSITGFVDIEGGFVIVGDDEGRLHLCAQKSEEKSKEKVSNYLKIATSKSIEDEAAKDEAAKDKTAEGDTTRCRVHALNCFSGRMVDPYVISIRGNYVCLDYFNVKCKKDNFYSKYVAEPQGEPVSIGMVGDFLLLASSNGVVSVFEMERETRKLVNVQSIVTALPDIVFISDISNKKFIVGTGRGKLFLFDIDDVIDGEGYTPKTLMKGSKEQSTPFMAKIQENVFLSFDEHYGIFVHQISPQGEVKNFKIEGALTQLSELGWHGFHPIAATMKEETIELIFSDGSSCNKMSITPIT